MEMIKLSVIVPVYNTPVYKLERCINSIQNIDLDYECILVDDGSTDENTIQFCKHTSNKNGKIKYYRQNNQGVSSARNNGILQSVGEYICFVDSDDEIVPDTFCIETFYGNQDIIFSDLILRTGGKDTIWKAFECNNIDRKIVVKALMKDGRLNGPVCKFIRRQFLVDNGLSFDTSLFEGEDALFIYNAILKNPTMGYWEQVSYVYYKEFSSLSFRLRKYKEKYLIVSDELYYKSLELIKLTDFEAEEENAIVNHLQSDHVGYIFSVVSDAICNKVFDNEFKRVMTQSINALQFRDFSKIGLSEKIYYMVMKNNMWNILNSLSKMRTIYLKIKRER